MTLEHKGQTEVIESRAPGARQSYNFLSFKKRASSTGLARQNVGVKMALNKKKRIPFFILTIVSLVFLFITIYKHGYKKALKVLFVNIGFAYVFETFVLAFFSAYQYKPNIIKKNMLDNMLGSILSQAIYVPIMATFISLFKLRTRWKLVITLYYVVIEQIFLRLKLFQHNWWKTIYTALFLPIAFYLSDFWSKKLDERNRKVGTISTYLTLNVALCNYLFTYAIFKKSRFKRKWRRTTLKEHVKVASAYALVIPILYTASAVWRGTSALAIVLILLTGVDFTFIRHRLLKTKNWFLHFLPMHAIMLLLAKYFAYIYNYKKT